MLRVMMDKAIWYGISSDEVELKMWCDIENGGGDGS